MHIVGILLIIAIWVVNVRDILFVARYSRKPSTKVLLVIALQAYTAVELLLLWLDVNLWVPFIIAVAVLAVQVITYIPVSRALYGESPPPDVDWDSTTGESSQNNKAES